MIEYRPVVGYSRDDATIRDLQRAVAVDPADATLLAKLRSYEVHGAWEPACFHTTSDDAERRGDVEGELLAKHPERVFRNEWWNDYSVIPGAPLCTDRNYGVFYLMTGSVRGPREEGTVPITKAPRGFPADASALAYEYLAAWGGDAHSASWLLLGEILPRAAELSRDYRDMVLRWAQDFDREHVRFVFFFDN